jgi:hypothetical protein
MTVDKEERITVDDALDHPWVVQSETIEENANTDAENMAIEGIKEFSMERSLIVALYAFIAMELFLKDESELFASKGEVTKEEAFELHRGYCGQSL